MSEPIQYSIHLPNSFICKHLHQLLPTWSVPILSVLVVLQRCQCNLLERTGTTEANKDELRDRFLKLGMHIAMALNGMGYAAEVFDPRTGLPVLSPSGSAVLDDVAIARTILGYTTTTQGECSIIIHPVWGSAVYPSTLVSSAPIHVLADIVNKTSEQFCGR